MTDWKIVIIESPFKGNLEASEAEHRAYLERCIADCISRGETPYASHKMLTDALDDGDPVQRTKGMSAGSHMSKALATFVGALPVFYQDYHESSGMNGMKIEYEEMGVRTECRLIGRNP